MLRIADLSGVNVVFDIDYEHLGMMGITFDVQTFRGRALPVAEERAGSPFDYATAASMAARRPEHRTAQGIAQC